MNDSCIKNTWCANKMVGFPEGCQSRQIENYKAKGKSVAAADGECWPFSVSTSLNQKIYYSQCCNNDAGADDIGGKNCVIQAISTDGPVSNFGACDSSFPIFMSDTCCTTLTTGKDGSISGKLCDK